LPRFFLFFSGAFFTSMVFSSYSEPPCGGPQPADLWPQRSTSQTAHLGNVQRPSIHNITESSAQVHAHLTALIIRASRVPQIGWGGNWVYLTYFYRLVYLCAKNYQILCRFDEVLTKQVWSFLAHPVRWTGLNASVYSYSDEQLETRTDRHWLANAVTSWES